jgi:hypothetical protein
MRSTGLFNHELSWHLPVAVAAKLPINSDPCSALAEALTQSALRIFASAIRLASIIESFCLCSLRQARKRSLCAAFIEFGKDGMILITTAWLINVFKTWNSPF